MALSLFNFSAMVNLAAAQTQAASTRLLNLSVGSVTRSILEGASSVALWLQYQIVQLWLGTRLATSTGTDVDTFVNDFSLTRLPAVPSTGQVTLSRFTASISAFILPYFNADGSTNASGVTLLTADLTQSFGVETDTTNPAWSAAMGGYLLPSGTLSVTVPAQALTPGLASNVQAGAISLITIPVPGVDTVTNVAVFSNGQDAESDSALKLRFTSYIATRARATLAAVREAILSTQSGLSYGILENTLPTGIPQPGYFTVTIDDGSGAPSSTLISSVYAAIDAVRPIGSRFTVQPPTIIVATVSMSITAAPNFSKQTLQGAVSSAIQAYINGLGIGQTLYYSRLASVAYGVPGVLTVTNLLLNNTTQDLGGGPTQVVKATSASVVIS